MEVMNGIGNANFAEGEANVLDKFKGFLSAIPAMVDFNEKAKQEQMIKQSADYQFNELVKTKATELAKERNKSFNECYAEARDLTQAENPELAQKLAQEIA